MRGWGRWSVSVRAADCRPVTTRTVPSTTAPAISVPPTASTSRRRAGARLSSILPLCLTGGPVADRRILYSGGRSPARAEPPQPRADHLLLR